jgi:hypothetical protein
MLPSPARHRQPLRLLSHVFPFLGKSDSYGEASRRSGEGAQRTVCLYNLLGRKCGIEHRNCLINRA